MTLPDFLGIGAPRCGTTWLHRLLASHPQIYVPTRRKEVRFFDEYYARGLGWYEQFFPDDKDAAKYRAIGEITPSYLYCHECSQRMARLGTVQRLFLMIRNPVDRAYSRYALEVRYRSFQGSFEDFCAGEPHGIQEGFYTRGLKEYLRHFALEQCLVLVYEQAVAKVPQTKELVAQHLGLDAGLFPDGAGTQRVHARYTPTRAKSIYAAGIALSRKFRDWDLYWANQLARRLRIRRLFGQSGELQPMKEETRRHLQDLYADEIRDLESLLTIDLSDWQ
jgi:hypothetical protein